MGEAKVVRMFHLSLRQKGIFAFIALFSYVMLVAFVIANQREILGGIVGELQQLHVVEERLTRVNTSVAYAILNVNEATTSGSRSQMGAIALDMEAIESGLRILQPGLPSLSDSIDRLERGTALIQTVPLPSSLIELREGLHAVVGELDVTTQQMRNRRQVLNEHYRDVFDRVTLIAVAMGSIGFIVFGGLVTLFFTRLARDLSALRERAVEVVNGYRGELLRVIRHDEVGSLMQAVNHMQHELRERDRKLEMSQRRQVHEEKMAAFGSLAAAVAHEINNPIAAISGIAEAMDEHCRTEGCSGRGVTCQPHLILEQARRIEQITRRLNGMTAQSSLQPGLVDLNEVVRSTCTFLGYDKRLRSVDVTLELDAQLPAVYAVSGHVIQVLMNLLINAADALETLPTDDRHITVKTQVGDGEVLLTVTDNGCGMNDATFERAFEEAFTTKPAGKGSGIGLFMCRMLMHEMEGDVELHSQVGRGTVATVHLPLMKSG